MLSVVGWLMSLRTCIHVKTNGLRCQSPALRHSVKCYYHHDHRRLTRRKVIQTLRSKDGRMAALQLVMNAVMNDRMNAEIARTLLYGIQIGTDLAP